MANNNNRLDDLDLDNFDFDDLDSFQSEDNKKQNKGPIRKIATSFAEGVGESLRDPAHLRRFASAALPEGYGTAINTVNSTYEGAEELYNTAAKELRTALPAMRRTAAFLSKSAGGVLPKGLVDKLDAFSRSEEQRARMDPDEENIRGDIAGIFGESAKVQAEQHADDRVDRKLRERVEDKQHGQTIRGLFAVQQGINRLVAYQDQITHKYQQKSLELQYRQYFATRDILKIHIQNRDRDNKFIEAMLINTSMSDATKARFEHGKTDTYARRLKDRFQQGVVGRLAKFNEQLMKNLGNTVQGIAGGVAQGFGMAEQMGDMAEMAESTGEGMGQMASREFGRGITEWLTTKISPALRNRLNKNQGLVKNGAKLNYMFQNIPEHLISWARKSSDATGWKGLLVNMFKDLIPRGGMDLSFGSSPLQSADQPAQFDQLTRRSITEIIPGYLSHIHLEIRRLRNPKASQMSYNLTKGKFTTKKEELADAKHQLFNPRQIGDGRAALENFAEKHIFRGRQVSEKAKEALLRQLAMDATSDRLFSPERLGTLGHETPELVGEEKEEIMRLMAGQFDDANGNRDYFKLNAAVEEAKRLRNAVIDPKAAMSAWRDAGKRDLLDKLGLLDQVHGEDALNMSKVLDYILAKPQGAGYGGAAGPQPPPYTGPQPPPYNGPQPPPYPGAQPPPIPVGGFGPQPPPFDPSGMPPEFTWRDRLRGAAYGLMDRHHGAARAADGKMAGWMQQARDFLKPHIARTSEAWESVRAHHREGTLIDAARLRLGEYKDQLTGEVLTRVEDIRGPVEDIYGNLVVSAQDIASGLYTSTGRQLNGVIERMRKNADTTAAGPSAAPTMGLGGSTAGAQEGGLNPQSISNDALLQVNTKQLDILTGIYEVLSTRNFAVAEGDGMSAGTRLGFMKRMKGLAERGWSGMSKMPGMLWRGMVRAPGKLWDATYDALGKFGRGAMTVGGGAAKLFGKYVKGVGKLGLGTVAAPFKAAGWMAGRGRDMLSDVYVRKPGLMGRLSTRVALYANKMRNGDYVLASDGKTPVKSIKDIKGAVMEINTREIVLTDEEYASGLFDSAGRTLFKGIVGGLAGFLKTVAGGYFAIAKLPFMALSGVAKIAKIGLGKLFEQPDVYLPGERTPRLTAFNMKRGLYRKEDGTIIKSFRDIDGPVYDHSGETPKLILDAEQAAKVCDISGKPLATRAEKLAKGLLAVGGAVLGAGAAVARGAMKLVKGTVGLGADIMLGTMKGIANFFNPKGGKFVKDSAKTHKLLEAIHDLLDARMPDPNGLRKGSWREQLKANAEKKKARLDALKEKNGGGIMGGALGKLKSVGKTLFGDDEEEDDDDGSMLDDAADAADIYDAANGDGGNDRRRKRAAKKRLKRMKGGRLSRMWNGAKGLGSKIPGKGALAKAGGKLSRFKPRGAGMGGLAAGLAMGLGGDYVADKLGGENTKAGRAVGTAANVAGWGMTGWSIASMLGMTGGITAAAGGIGTAALAAGGAVLGVLTAPVTLAVGAIALAGYGIYKGYKYYQNHKDAPYRVLRMAQYGVDATKQIDEMNKIQSLEDLLKDSLTFIDGKADFDEKKIDTEKLFDIFDLKPGMMDRWFSDGAEDDYTDKQRTLMAWLGARFKPVYLSWVTALKGIDPKMDLGDVDDGDLKPDQGKKLLTAVKMPDGFYSDPTSPFGKDPLPMGAKEVNALYSALLASVEKELKGAVGKDGKPLPGKAAAAAAGAAGAAAAGKGGQGGGGGTGKKPEEKSSWLQKAAMFTMPGLVAAGANKLLEIFRSKKGSLTFKAVKGVNINVSNLSALEAIRLRGYGLMDMDSEKVRALMQLESGVLSVLKVNPNGEMAFDGNSEQIFQESCASFGLSADDRGGKARWIGWFENRFLPVLTAFVGATLKARSGAQITSILAIANTLPAVAKLDIGLAVQNAKRTVLMFNASVWSYDSAPWPNMILNTDPKTVVDNLDAIREEMKKATVTEAKSAKAGGKNAKGVANTALANAQAAQQNQTFGAQMKNWASNAWNSAKEFASNAWDGMKEIGRKVAEHGDRLVESATTAAGNAWEGFKQGITGGSGRAQKAAQYASQKCGRSSVGRCARYVADALEAAGYSFQRQPSAYMYASNGVLAQMGFSRIPEGTAPQAGDIIVINRTAKHVHGHIQIYDGKNWISDFRQNSSSPYREKIPFTMWRDMSSGTFAAKVGGLAGQAVGGAALAAGRSFPGINADALWRKVAPLISKGESNGNYDAQNGVQGNVTPGLSQMTIGAVLEQAKKVGASDGNGPKTGAVGKYQFIPKTLLAACKMAGLSMDDTFSPENQEKMARCLFDMRVGMGVKGGPTGVIDQLSMEWASLPSASKGGRGWYDGISGNKAHGGQEKLRDLMGAVAGSANQIGPPLQATGGAKGGPLPGIGAPLPAASPAAVVAPDISRSNDLQLVAPKTAEQQDQVITQRQQAVQQQAAIGDYQGQQANLAAQQQIATMVATLQEQLTVQKAMEGHLKEIKNGIGNLKGSQLSKMSEETTPAVPAQEPAQPKRMPRGAEDIRPAIAVPMRRTSGFKQ